MAGFGEYYVSLGFITSCMFWAVRTVAVWYSNTATQKYIEFTEMPLKFGLRSNDSGFYYILTKYDKPAISPDHTPDAAHFVIKYTRVTK
jgi:hypothetical protein